MTSTETPLHPFANSKSRIEIIPSESRIDIEEEARIYDAMCYNEDEDEDRPKYTTKAASQMNRRPTSRRAPPSVATKSIWLDDNIGSSDAFARDVSIAGWTSVGDKPEGAYIVYDCVVRTKEGILIHAHKRYSAFAELETTLHRTLPRHLVPAVPALPPKAPLARFRPAFLTSRQRMLQHWLTAVLLHPEIGSSQGVREWMIN